MGEGTAAAVFRWSLLRLRMRRAGTGGGRIVGYHLRQLRDMPKDGAAVHILEYGRRSGSERTTSRFRTFETLRIQIPAFMQLYFSSF